MTEHLSFEQLCDFADAALGAALEPAAETAARAHLRGCAACTARLSSITALAARTNALPEEIAPPADLWGAIRNALAPRDVTGRRGEPAWRRRQTRDAANLGTLRQCVGLERFGGAEIQGAD